MIATQGIDFDDFIISNLKRIENDKPESNSNDEAVPLSKKARISVSSTTIVRDNRPFVQFFEEEGLVEVVRKYKKYPVGSACEIKPNGELWIANEKTDVVISKETQVVMQKEGIWGKKLTVRKDGYVIVGNSIGKKLHTILAASKKDSDFHDLLELGWKEKKTDLEVLHLDDNPYNFNIDNLKWNTHGANLLLRLSYGTPNASKFQSSFNINGKFENSTSCPTKLEARHAGDVLKINNVQEIDRNFVFNHGLNIKYPSIEVLLARSHLYKSQPTHRGKMFKSNGIVTLLTWEKAENGLKQAVENSKVPFDNSQDVLVYYHGKYGITIMVVIEQACYAAHLLGKQFTFYLSGGYVYVKTNEIKTALHRLVLGLGPGDFKVGQHRVQGIQGKLDNRRRVLKKGNHASNMGDVNRKTISSTSKYDGVCWDATKQRYRATISFSNIHVKFRKSYYFGDKGNKSSGEEQASVWRNHIKDNMVPIIHEKLNDIEELADFKQRVIEEIQKL